MSHYRKYSSFYSNMPIRSITIKEIFVKIELKNVKINQSFSEETLCFTAKFYVNGKKAGSVSNAGHGGACDVDFDDPMVEKQVVDYINSLPEEICEDFKEKDGSPMKIKITLDYFFADLADKVEKAQYEKNRSKKLAKFREKCLLKGLPVIVEIKTQNTIEWRGLKSIEQKDLLAQKLKINPDLIVEV